MQIKIKVKNMRILLAMAASLLCLCSEATAKFGPRAESGMSCGSGFFVTKSGYLITNYHVVEGGQAFVVLTSTGALEAKLIRVDPATDLALLKVEKTVVACKLSRKRKEKLGTEIFTLGFPQPDLQGFSPKVTKGVVSGTDGLQDDVRHYQIDASIQPGNSGGPLFDANGHVVGVLVSTLRTGQLVNYAIKKAYLRAFLDSAGVCGDDVEETDDKEVGKLTDVVSEVRPSCVMVINYK